MPVVNIPNVGAVNFPDSMSQADILSAIQNDILPNYVNKQAQEEQQTQAPAQQAPTEGYGLASAFKDVISAPGDVLSPSQATLGAGEKGIVNAKQAVSNAQLAQLINNQAADKEQYGEYYERAPKSELEKISARDKTIEDKIQNLAEFGLERKAIEEKRGVNPLTKTLGNLRGSEEYKAADSFDQLKMIGNAMWDKRGDLPGYVGGVALESLPATVPTIVAAMAARFGGFGPKGAAIMGGSGSALTEFGNQYAELRAEGMDHKEAWEKAGVKSAVIGLFDAASFKSAGNSAGELLKNVEKGFIKEAAKETGKEVGVQALYGMAGEALGSVAINQKIDPLDVLEEGIGEIAGAPLEATSTFKFKQQEAVEAANKPTPPPVVNPPAPPAGPQITTAVGTPIVAAPLDTAEKQIAAKAAAPITPTTTPDVEEQAKAKSVELGIPLEDARKLVGAPAVAAPVSTVNAINTGNPELDTIANKLKAKYNLSNERAIKQATEVVRQQNIVNQGVQNGRTQPSTGVDAGINQPSVSVPQAGLQPTGGVTTSQPAGLASTIGTTGVPGVRAEAVQAAEPSALSTVPQNIIDLHAKSVAADEANKVSSTPANKRNATMAARRLGEAKAAQLGLTYEDYLKESNPQAIRALDDAVASQYNQLQETPAAVAPEVIPAPTATKGKRTGRPRVELTYEQQAEKKQAKAAQTKDWKAATKTVQAAIETLDTPEPIRDNFATQDAYLDAGVQHRARRNQALDTLHEISKGQQRDSKPGKAAKEALSHPSVTTQEQANLQQRIEIKKKAAATAGKPSKSETSGTPDSKYYSFDNASQAINYIANNGTLFERFLAKRLRPFLKGVNLIVVNAANEVPESLRTNFKGANGLYAATELNGKSYRTIYLRGESFGNSTDFQGVNNTVFLHEALHAAVNARIDEWRSLLEEGKEIPQKLGDAINGLMDVMRNASREYAYQTLTGTINVDPRVAQLFTSEAEGGIQIYDDLKEFVAYGLTEDSMQQFLFQIKGEIVPNQPGRFRSLFNRFVRSIRDLFDMDDSHQSALQDLIVLTEGLLKYDTELQEAPQVSAARQKKAKAQKLDQDTKKVMRSQNIHDIAEGFGGWVKDGHDFGDLVDLLKARFKGMTEDAIKTTLMTLRTSDIIRWMGDKIAGLKEIDEFTQKMAAMRTNMLEAYAAKADQLAKFIVSNKGSDKILGNAMHLARLKGVTPDAHATAIEAANNDPKVIELTKLIEDPATPAEKISNLTGQRTRRKNDIQIVYDAWTQLGKIEGGHEMYKMVRQFYKDNFNLQRHYLDERIERLQELPGDVKDEKTPKGQLMAEIRKMQEKDAIQEYFPLMRHGPAWFRESGTDGGFILFDEPWQRELYAIKRAKELGKPVEELFKDLTFTSGNDIASLRNTNQRESTMLKNMFEIIDKANLDEISSEDLKDSLYQTWLTTLPEASIRKQFMHAENVSGFSADIFRNFTESANRMASQTPRLKYADQMQTEITRARDSLAGDPDQAKLGLFIDTVGGRAMEQLNPPSPNQLASIATRYAYYMLLTGAGSAAVQLVAVPVMIYPVLGARYGYARASLKFAAYSNILGSMGVNIKETPETIRGYHIPSVTVSVADSSRIKNSKTLSAAYQALKERGLFAFTENNLLSQRGRTPLNATLSGPKKALRMTANIMSGLFSGAERVSREIAAMMAFEMHYDKTKNFEESVEKAIAAVQDNMGRYDAMERPELFKKLPVISQFKMYAANMTSFFVRHAYNSTKVISDPKLAFESMKILTGVLMMGAMFHGLKGMPLYSVVGAVVEALSDLGDDDEEKRRKRARNPLVAQNADLRFREFLNDNFGPVMGDVLYSGPISSLTDINIGAKTSFDNLWFRGGKPAKTNQEAFNNFVLANIGPAVSGILGQTGALDDFENGHIERGLEKMLPAFFKNPLVAGRLATEGAKTKGGDTIIKKEDVTAANVIAQAAGFAPTKLARQQEVGFELKGEYVKAEQERTQILQRLTDSVLNKDFGGGQKDVQPVINQIRQFNKRYPMDKVMIDGDAIQNTLDSALEARARTYKGVRIPTEAMIPYFVPVLNQGKK